MNLKSSSWRALNAFLPDTHHIRLPEEYYVGYIAFPKDYATAVKAAQIDSNGLPDDVEITCF